jgi:hypothetical protein
LASLTGTADIATGAAVRRIAHEIHTLCGGARATRFLVVQADARTKLTGLIGQAANVVARAAVRDVGHQIGALVIAHLLSGRGSVHRARR